MKKKPTGKDSVADTNKTTKGRPEKDIDDLVHSGEEELPTELGEQDPDDLVHQPKKRDVAGGEESMEDPDDLVHGYEEGEEE
jgi:hypothetical protein